jgi:hypothetical protein
LSLGNTTGSTTASSYPSAPKLNRKASAFPAKLKYASGTFPLKLKELDASGFNTGEGVPGMKATEENPVSFACAAKLKPVPDSTADRAAGPGGIPARKEKPVPRAATSKEKPGLAATTCVPAIAAEGTKARYSKPEGNPEFPSWENHGIPAFFTGTAAGGEDGMNAPCEKPTGRFMREA